MTDPGPLFDREPQTPQGVSTTKLVMFFLLVFVAAILLGLLGYWYYLKQHPPVQQQQKAAMAPAASAASVAKVTPAQPAEVLGIKIPDGLSIYGKPEVHEDGSGNAILYDPKTTLGIRIDRGPSTPEQERTTLQLFAGKTLDPAIEKQNADYYNQQQGVAYKGMDGVYLSDGTQYRTVAYFQQDPGMGLVAKQYMELVFPDKSRMTLMAYKPHTKGADEELQAVNNFLQDFLTKTGVDDGAEMGSANQTQQGDEER